MQSTTALRFPAVRLPARFAGIGYGKGVRMKPDEKLFEENSNWLLSLQAESVYLQKN